MLVLVCHFTKEKGRLIRKVEIVGFMKAEQTWQWDEQLTQQQSDACSCLSSFCKRERERMIIQAS